MQSDFSGLENAIYRAEQAQANVQTMLGDLSEVLGDHRSLGDAFGLFFDRVHHLESSSVRYNEEAREREEKISEDIKKQDTTIQGVLRVIHKVARTAGTRSGLIEERVTSLENARDRLVDSSTPVDTSYHEPSVEDMIDNMLNNRSSAAGSSSRGTTATTTNPPASAHPTSTPISLTTVVGEVEVGGSKTTLTVGDLVARIETLESQIAAKSPYTGSEGFSFGKLSFPGENEFITWFVAKNPAGKGLAAVVDIMSVWEFANSEQVSSTDWLQSYHRSHSSGFKSTLEPHYAATFSNRYPKVFVGSVDMLLPTDRIKIFQSVAVWRGNGIGDGVKERLLSSLRLAVQRHRQYCEDNLPSGTFREHAIRSSEECLIFFNTLVNHFDDEMSMLTSIGMPEKEVMLLISNQMVQICDDLYVLRQLATNVDNSNTTVAAARYAWVTFLALDKMKEFSKNIQQHPSINTTYTRFLTRMTAESSSSGLKTKLTKVEEIVKKLSQEKASVTNLNKVDNKLELIIRVNELKRSSN